MKWFLIIITLIALIGLVTSQVIIKDSQAESLNTLTINKYIEYEDTPSNYGTSGQCAGVNAGGLGMDWLNCLTSLNNIFDQSLNTTDNVTFQNISANDISANCIEDLGFFEWTLNNEIPDVPTGSIPYEASIDRNAPLGRQIPFNLTVTNWMAQVYSGSCNADATLGLFLTETTGSSRIVDTLVVPVVSFKIEHFNETFPNPGIDFNYREQIGINWTANPTICTNPAPSDMIITIMYKRRCP